MANFQNAAELIAAMTSVVEANGYKFLTGYKDDFYVHDVNSIKANYEPGVTYIWVVRENGTHLNQIGIHERETEGAIAAIEAGARATSLGCAVYLVSSSGVKLIDEKQARNALTTPRYKVANNAIFRKSDSSVIATYSMRHSSPNGMRNQCFDVHFQATSLDALPTFELAALRTIAFREAEAMAQSLFVKIGELKVNGLNLDELIDQRHTKKQQPALA